MMMLEQWRVLENTARALKDLHAMYILQNRGVLAHNADMQYRQARNDADRQRYEIMELMGVDS